MYDKIVIGLDQSYTKTGISVCADGKLIKVTSAPFRGARNKSDKRRQLRGILSQLIPNCQLKASKVVVLVERIRLYSGGALSISYIKATGALIATIVDVANEFGINVFSADTRAWKSKVVGTSKGSDGSNKIPTIRYVEKLGFGSAITSVNKKGRIVYDDDAADSACIALYGFIPLSKQKLKKEE